MRLVQLSHPEKGRSVAVVDEPQLCLLDGSASVYDLAMEAIEKGISLTDAASSKQISEQLDYNPVYEGESKWRLLPPLDHPEQPALCLVAGTGLTHIASAKNRDAMHAKESDDAPLSDSMKMFQWGVEGGKPAAGEIGVQPEWFYKGDGTVLRGHNEALDVPKFADDGGEEPEIAGLYVIAPDGLPRRVGFSVGNEFSDHIMEKKNYLYLAPSKLRTASVGPEVCLDASFEGVSGTVRVERAGDVVWTEEISTGEANMSHSLSNLEQHHFKYRQHRRPGDVHVHYFGADAFSFGAGVALEDGDVMVVEWQGFGRPLRNPIRINSGQDELVDVCAL
tara:strand:+ start:1110 stop:2114 length:1005 start_codon:yes stop_codon:yes gene_type:complete